MGRPLKCRAHEITASVEDEEYPYPSTQNGLAYRTFGSVWFDSVQKCLRLFMLYTFKKYNK